MMNAQQLAAGNAGALAVIQWAVSALGLLPGFPVNSGIGAPLPYPQAGLCARECCRAVRMSDHSPWLSENSTLRYVPSPAPRASPV
jgi:hypothetical protein